MKKPTGRPRKTARNKLLVRLVKEGKTYQEVADLIGLKSRANVCEIFQRECSGKTS